MLKKSKKYGDNLDLPYIIAVNSFVDYVNAIDDVDIIENSFGIGTNTFHSNGEKTNKGEANGFWVGTEGPINRQVSGVFVASQLFFMINLSNWKYKQVLF